MASNAAPTRGEVLITQRQQQELAKGGVGLVAAMIAQRERMSLSATDYNRPRGHGPINDDPISYIREPRFIPGQPVTEFKRDDKDRRPGTPVVLPNDGPAPDRPHTREEILAYNERVRTAEDEDTNARCRKYFG